MSLDSAQKVNRMLSQRIACQCEVTAMEATNCTNSTAWSSRSRVCGWLLCMLCAGNMADEFYLRYYTGHQGKFGHEFLEFEFRLLVQDYNVACYQGG